MKPKSLLMIGLGLTCACGFLDQERPPRTEFETLWTRTFGGSASDAGRSVQQTTDGGFIVAGTTCSFGAGSCDVWLIKTDADGDTLWTRTFGGSASDVGRSVQQTTDGGYIVVGSTASFGGGKSDVWLIRTGADGDIQWQRTFGDSLNEVGRSVQQTTDGGYIIAGEISYGFPFYDVLVIKTDASGNEEWSRTLGRSTEDRGYSVQQTTDGGYIIGGMTFNVAPGYDDVWLLKTDANGNETWNTVFDGRDLDWGYFARQTIDGGYIIIGYTGHNFRDPIPDVDVWLIKTNSSGEEEWQQSYGGSAGDRGYSVQQTADGGYIIAAMTKSSEDSNGDVWLIKTDESGNMLKAQTFGGNRSDTGFFVQQTTDGGYIITGETWSYGGGKSDVWLIRLAPEL